MVSQKHISHFRKLEHNTNWQILSYFMSRDFFICFLCFHVCSVVPINATIRLPNEEWSDELSNTTSEAFMNLSRKLEINVSFHW